MTKLVFSNNVKMKPIPLDGGYGWVIVAGSFLIHVITDGFVYSFGEIADKIIRDFKATNAETSTIISLFTGLMLVIGPMGSYSCNKLGCRLTTIIGAAISIAGCAASYFATSISFLVITVGITMGIGTGMMYCSSIIIVTIYFEKYRSLATGIAVCGAGVGTIIFAYVNAVLLKYFHWKIVFLIYAGILLLCIPTGLLFLPVKMTTIDEECDLNSIKNYAGDVCAKKIQKSKISLGDKIQPVLSVLPGSNDLKTENVESRNNEIINHKKQNFSSQLNQLNLQHQDNKFSLFRRFVNYFHLSLFFDPVFIIFSTSLFFGSLGYNSIPYFMPLHASARFPNSSAESTTISVYGLANIIGRIGFGLLCNYKFFFKWGKDCVRNRMFIYVFSLMVCGVVTCFVYVMQSIEIFVAFCFFFGSFMSSFICLWSVIFVDLFGVQKLTSGFGILLFIQGCASFIGPLTGAKISDITKNYDWTFVLYGLFFLFGGLVMFVIIPIKRRRKKNNFIL